MLITWEVTLVTRPVTLVTRSYMRKNGGELLDRTLLERVGDKAVEMCCSLAPYLMAFPSRT